MKKILSTAVALSLVTTSLFAADSKTDTLSSKAVSKAQQKAQKNPINQIIKEAVEAIKYTQEALMYLSSNNKQKALDALKNAVGQLAVVLNTPNPPYLLPVDVEIEAYHFEGKLKDIRKTVEQAKKLVRENRLPEARALLNTLRDEIVIKSVNLPLATYPAALNLAIKYVNENKIKEAQEVLQMALNTLVEIDTIIPIPLIKAEALIQEASKIVNKNSDQAVKYLEEAKYQLKLAEALGYTSKSSTTYKMLRDEIEKIEKEIKAHHKTGGLFEELLKKLKEFKEKSIQHINK